MELYIHIPFCVRKCRYCDFFSGPENPETMHRYVEELKKEIISSPFEQEKITSIFMGGGTPSLLESKLLAEIFEAIHKKFQVEKDAEITIECNPGTLTEEKCATYRGIGINRISMGLQSDSDEVLKFLGRIHTRDTFLKSYDIVRRAGFENVSFDLISGLPGVSLKDFEKTLSFVTALSPEHLSVYDLILEEGTPLFDDYENGKFRLPSEENDRAIYHRTKEVLSDAGYERYEISNYAKEKFESKHNIGYWTSESYLGFGASAASYLLIDENSTIEKLSDRDWANEKLSAGDWANEKLSAGDLNLLKPGDGIRFKNASSLSYRTKPAEEVELLTKENLMSEFMILGLRMTQGVSDTVFQKRFSKSFFDVFEKAIQKGINEKTLVRSGNQLCLTELGLDVANHVMCEFM